jgi:hypothetical protein
LKSGTFLVTTVKPWILAVTAIMASSYTVSDFPCISCAQALKADAFIGSTLYEAATISSQASISAAFAGSCSRVSSMPA